MHERERLSGYKLAMQGNGTMIRDSFVWASTFDGKEIESACQKRLIRAAKRPSALFTTNGVVALEALRSIYAFGLSTPEDIGFATLDEIAAADLFRPAITTVVQPTFDMGHRAVEVLLDRIARGDESAPSCLAPSLTPMFGPLPMLWSRVGCGRPDTFTSTSMRE